MEKRHDFNEVVNRIHTECYKWDYEAEGGKYISLGVADTDFKSPEPVIEALKGMAEYGIFGYGVMPKKRFRDAVCKWYRERHSIKVEPEWIEYSQGLMNGALWLCMDAFTRAGDKVVIQPPVYNTFQIVVEEAGRHIVTNPLICRDGRYEMDYRDLEEKVSDPRVRILLLCNPHNPIGRLWTREELLKVYQICKKYDTLIISDEIHGDLLFEGRKQVPFFSISDDVQDNVIVMGSPSKTFNLASFYSSYVVIKNARLRAQFAAVYNKYHFDYNRFGMEALITAYNECGYYVDQLNAYLWKNIAIVKEFLERVMPEVKMAPPEATYLLWINFSAWPLNQFELINFLKDCGIVVNSGAAYGEGGEGYIRMNIACQTALLEQVLGKLEQGYERTIKRML